MVLAAVDPRELDGPVTAGVGDQHAFSAVLEHLADTTFTSYDVQRMLAATREMEDRAWRKGTGELHGGCQRRPLSAPRRASTRTWRRNGSTSTSTVRPPTTSPTSTASPPSGGHPRDTRSWFVVYDGDGDPQDARALLAEERGASDERSSYGFWTYNPTLVGRVVDRLGDRYLVTV